MPVRGRSLKERLADLLLFIFAVNDANQKGGAGGITKLEKLIFLSELEMLKAHEKGFNYSFIKLPRGPYSSEIEKTDIPRLEKLGYLSKRINEYEVTEEGVQLLKELADLFKRNQRFVETIRGVSTEYSNLAAGELVDRIHEMPPPYRRAGRTINDVPLRTVLLRRIRDENASLRFSFTESELATLELYLDPDAQQSVQRAVKSAASEPSLPWKEVLRHAEELHYKSNAEL